MEDTSLEAVWDALLDIAARLGRAGGVIGADDVARVAELPLDTVTTAIAELLGMGVLAHLSSTQMDAMARGRAVQSSLIFHHDGEPSFLRVAQPTEFLAELLAEKRSIRNSLAQLAEQFEKMDQLLHTMGRPARALSAEELVTFDAVDDDTLHSLVETARSSDQRPIHRLWYERTRLEWSQSLERADRLMPWVMAVAQKQRAVARFDSPVREPIPEQVRHEVWRRDNGRCVVCGNQGRLEFDHIIPVAKGGANTARNLQLLCEPCNRTKSDRI